MNAYNHVNVNCAKLLFLNVSFNPAFFIVDMALYDLMMAFGSTLVEVV